MRLILKTLILLSTILFSLEAVHALAIAQPMPSNITLKRGESLPFRFNVQAVTSKEDQHCTYSMTGLNSLTVTFEKEEIIVEAGKELDVYGSIEVPTKAPTKEYKGEFIVSCNPNIEVSGVSVMTQSTRFPFFVKVEKSGEEEGLDWKYILAFFIVVIIIVISVIIKSKYGQKNKESKNKSQ